MCTFVEPLEGKGVDHMPDAHALHYARIPKSNALTSTTVHPVAREITTMIRRGLENPSRKTLPVYN